MSAHNTNSISIEHFVGRVLTRHNQCRVKTRPTEAKVAEEIPGL
jgi:hypothetical protein